MSFECLKLMCKIFAEGDNPEYAFAWPFLLLEWNLIARANSVCDLRMNDVEWRDDALLLFLRKTKTDQEGREGQTPYHIYFNSCDPYLNVGLSLGLYFLKHPNILTSTTNKVFPAEFQYNRSSRILHQVVKENAEAFRRIGVEVGDIGTHSARKGAATHAASGCTISPAMAAICNRAGWALGGSRDKYIKYEAAGDQFLGRTLCGLDPLSISFSVSPPFFDLGNAGIAELDSWIHATMRGSRDTTNNIFRCFRYVFVVVVLCIIVNNLY